MSTENTNNKEDLQKKLGELGDLVHNKLKEQGQSTDQADAAVKGVQDFIDSAYGKVENADDKEQAQKDIAQSLLGKFEQYTGKGETNKPELKKE